LTGGFSGKTDHQRIKIWDDPTESVVYRNLVLEKHGDSPRKSRGLLGLKMGYFMWDLSNIIFQIFHGDL
jgi:hypothetical protein